jgi:ribose transport system permease protein
MKSESEGASVTQKPFGTGPDGQMPAAQRASSTSMRIARAALSAMVTPQGFLLALIVAIGVVTSLRSQYFLTTQNIENIARQIAVSGILAGGTTLLMLSGLIDLSIGAATAFVGLVAIKLVLSAGLPFVPALAAAVAMIIVINAAMGLVIATTKVPSFMLTLAVWTALGGVDLLIQGDFPIVLPDGRQYTLLGQDEVLPHLPYSVVLCVAVWVVVWCGMRWSGLVQQAKAMGSNEEAARLSGLRIDRLKVAVFAFNGLIVGVAGMVLVSQLGSAAATSGSGLEIQTIAAVVIGGAGLEGGRASMVGSALGVILLGVISNSLNLLHIRGQWQVILYGAIIAVAVIGREVRVRGLVSIRAPSRRSKRAA